MFADCLVIADRFGPAGTLVVDASGRVERVEWQRPLAGASQTPALPGITAAPASVLLPACADPLPLAELEDAFACPLQPEPTTSALPHRLATLRECMRNSPPPLLTRRLVHLLTRLARRGVGTVGLPAVGALSGASVRTEMLDAVVAAAEAVGLRVAFLLPLEAPGGHVGPLRASQLEEYAAAVDATVRHLHVRRNPLVSWALWVPSPRQLDAITCISLRLRLGHLPLLVAAPAEAVPLGAPGLLAMLRRFDCLDAAVTVLAPCAPNEQDQALLAATGALWLNVEAAPATAGWTSARLTRDHVAAQVARANDVQRALGLRRTRLLSGGWGDVVVRPWAAGGPASVAAAVDPSLSTATIDARPAGAGSQPAMLFVAGRPVAAVCPSPLNQ